MVQDQDSLANAHVMQVLVIGAGVAGLAAIQCPGYQKLMVMMKMMINADSHVNSYDSKHFASQNLRQAKNMGCIVRAFDVRPATREQVVAAGGRVLLIHVKVRVVQSDPGIRFGASPGLFKTRRKGEFRTGRDRTSRFQSKQLKLQLLTSCEASFWRSRLRRMALAQAGAYAAKRFACYCPSWPL